MNLDKNDLVTHDRDLQEYARQLAERGWWRRNWRWFVPVLLLALIAFGAGAAYWALYARVYHLELYQTVMRQIAADEQLQQELGQPIEHTYWPPPSPRLEETEKDIRWPIAGPKGEAKAHVFASLRQGEWQVVQLEVVLANGKKVRVADAGDGEADAPKFEAPMGETQKTEASGPAPVINLPIPPNDGPGM